MALTDDLLVQARHLALVDAGKPKQANLRRAVSAAYYSLFHLLLDDGSAAIGSKLSQAARSKIRRAYAHAEMKAVCSQYARAKGPSTLHPQIAPLLVFPINTKLKNVADIFLHLQEARHLADYDISCRFNRVQVLALIDATMAAFEDWKATKSTANARIFLVDLVLRKSWSRT